MNETRQKGTASLLWVYSGKLANQGLTFVISIILARILLPEEFGIMAIALVFLSILQVIQNFGFGFALIHHDNVTQEDWSSVFYFNIMFNLILFIISFLVAYPVSDFYNQDQLVPVIQLLSLNFIVSSLSSVHNIRFRKELNFRAREGIGLASTVVAGSVVIWLALNGWGVFSLVFQSVIRNIVMTIMFWIVSKWRPSLVFSIQSLKKYMKYSLNLLFTNIISKIFDGLDALLIGKFYSSASLGYYNRAKNLREFPVKFMSPVFSQVMFPLLSKFKDDFPRLKRYHVAILHIYSFIIPPLMLMAMALSEPFVMVVYTAKWASMIPIFQVLCFGAITNTLGGVCMNLLWILDKTSFALKFTLIKKTIITTVYIISVQFGFMEFVYTVFCVEFILYFVNIYFTGRYIAFYLPEHLKIISVYLFMALSAAITAYVVINNFEMSYSEQLIVGGIIGVVIYGSLSLLFKVRAIKDLKETVFQVIKK